MLVLLFHRVDTCERIDVHCGSRESTGHRSIAAPHSDAKPLPAVREGAKPLRRHIARRSPLGDRNKGGCLPWPSTTIGFAGDG